MSAMMMMTMVLIAMAMGIVISTNIVYFIATIIT